uniref:Uncharacterized protein n=1 Tax=Romanomermis culicivorax TaxID=13658 RepID=A0A915KQT5_ROMCU
MVTMLKKLNDSILSITQVVSSYSNNKAALHFWKFSGSIAYYFAEKLEYIVPNLFDDHIRLGERTTSGLCCSTSTLVKVTLTLRLALMQTLVNGCVEDRPPNRLDFMNDTEL